MLYKFDVRLDQEDKDELKRLAKAKRKSISALVREYIAGEVKKLKQQMTISKTNEVKVLSELHKGGKLNS